jgi:hypothetical protein
MTEFETEAIRLLTSIDERLKQDNELVVIAAELAQIRKLLTPPTHKAEHAHKKPPYDPTTDSRLYRLVVAGVVVALIISISLSFFPQLAWKP